MTILTRRSILKAVAGAGALTVVACLRTLGAAGLAATGAPAHRGIGERLDGFHRFELTGPDLPAGGDGECPVEPDGVAHGGRGRSNRPPSPLPRCQTPRRHDAQQNESGRHRFSRRARSAKARRSSTPYGTLVWSATRSTPA